MCVPGLAHGLHCREILKGRSSTQCRILTTRGGWGHNRAARDRQHFMERRLRILGITAWKQVLSCAPQVGRRGGCLRRNAFSRGVAANFICWGDRSLGGTFAADSLGRRRSQGRKGGRASLKLPCRSCRGGGMSWPRVRQSGPRL